MALTPITSYPVPHDKGGGSGGSTYIMGGSKSSTYNSLNVNSINAKLGNIDNLQSHTISANDAMILYLQSKEGMIIKISGDQLDYKNGVISSLVSDDIGVKKLKADVIEAMNAFISTLQSREITTEYLTVTKQAHFFELIIDKIRSVGGQLIITPASCVADYVKGYIPGTGLVEPTTSNYDSITYFVVYWRAEDDDGRSIDRGFIQNDQAICQSFNVHEGTNNNVANKYYWRLVDEVYDDDIYINLTTGAETTVKEEAQNNEYHIIMLDTKTLKDENEYFDNDIKWTVKEQRIEGIETNVDWIESGELNGAAVNGKFVSASQVYGIQITPDKYNLTSYLDFIITQEAGENSIVPTKINIGVYFKDDTFKIWNGVHLDDDRDNFGHVRLDLEDADAPIEAITIVSTADVNWHRCHRMKLSNTVKDDELQGYANIPSAGDNIVQLGYRTNIVDDPNINRQSAIIISAYKSIDQGGVLEDDTIVRPIVAPSYAQYIGIDDFHLYTHRQSFIDGSGARFIGDISLCSVNGKALTETIQDSVKMLLVDTASVMINTQDGSDTVTSITPSTINIKILTVEDDETVQLSTVPEGYKLKLTYFNASGQEVLNVTYGIGETAGASISNISLLMLSNINSISRLRINLNKYVTSGGTTKLIIIDTKEIPYIRAARTNTAGRYEFRYCNYVPTQDNPLPVKPTDYSDGIGIYGSQIRCIWDISVNSPDSENGEYTYMSQCFRNAGGSYGTWSNPIRITGANGKDGEDGSDIEYIYTRNNTGVAPAAPSGTSWGDDWPNVDGNTPSAQDNHGTTWYDNPQGVSSSIMYEYVSMRQKSHGGNWSEYCTPVIWSNWGIKGQDGDGFEYIYILQASTTPPADPTPADYATNTTYQNSNEYVTYITRPNGVDPNYWWKDDPSSVTQSAPYLYVSVRKRTSGEGWGRFSTPSLWARYAEQGETGGHYEFRYRNATNLTSSDKPTGTGLTNGWSNTPSNPNIANNEFTWMSQCYVIPATPNDNYGTWSDPVRITGGDGDAGTDGTDIEFVYAQTEDTDQIPAPPTNQIPDWPNDGNTDHETVDNGDGTETTWYDNPQGVTQNVRYEWMSMRYKTGGHGGVGGTYSAYTTPVIWSAFGNKGMDGDGFEYIYKQSAELSGISVNMPNDWEDPTSIYQTVNEYAPYLISYGWTDDPQGVSETLKYEWVSVRKRTNGSWGEFSTPSLWARWAMPGQSGGHYEFRYRNATNLTSSDKPTGTGLTNGWSNTPSNPNIANNEFTWMSQCYVIPATPNDNYGTWSDPVRITGGDGDAGTDGTDIEFVYAQTEDTDQIPAPPTNQIDDWPNDGYTDHETVDNGDDTETTWYDNPQGVTENVRYEWMSMRYKTGGQGGVGGTWSAYTTPVIWSAFGEKGQDGDGYEYIYNVTDTSTAPDNPTPDDWATDTDYQGSNEYAPYLSSDGWTDDPQNTTPIYRWQWVCVRKRQNNQWQPFSNPTLWSNYSVAENAVPGSDGEDAELDILVPITEAFYADIKTALSNNSSTKVKLNLKYSLNKKVGSDVTQQSWSDYSLTFDLYSSTYSKITSNSINIPTLSGGIYKEYTQNDVLYRVLNMGPSSDWLALSSNPNNWNTLPAYAQVTLKKNNKVVSEPRVVPLQIDGGAFQLVMDNKIQEVVGDTVYSEGLENYLQTSYATREMLSDEVTTQVNTMTMSRSDIDQALSEIRQTANEISLNVTDNYTTTEDLTTRLYNAGIEIAANNTDGGMINLNGDNVNVNGSLNVYDEAGEGFSVWNGTKDEATKSTQIRNKEIGSVQNWLIANTSGGTSNMKCLNIIGIDGMILGHPATYSTDIYKKFLWWGNTDYDHLDNSNGYEFIVRNLYHNFRVSENGIYRTSAQNIYNRWLNLDSFYESDNKNILTNEDIRSGGAAGANMRWSDASTTTPVCIFSESEKNFTKDSAGNTNSKFPDAMFRTCGIFVSQGADTTIWLPWPDYCIGRTIFFKCVNGNLTLKIAYPLSTGKIMLSGNNKLVNIYNAGRWSVQLVSDGVRWIVLQGALNDTDNNG